MKAPDISFPPLREDDLPLVQRWLNTPHVSEWWSLDGSHHPSLEEVSAKYSPRLTEKEPVDCYIIGFSNKPIGMIQACNLDDYPAEKKTFGVAGRCISIDLFIGEEDYVHRGLGADIIRCFLKDVVFADPAVDHAVIDPQVENIIAIRAYEKAGFKHMRTVWYEPDKVREAIMTISRDAIFPGKSVQSS